MDIKQLRAFLAVADSRSFLKAADELYISRQAISKTIGQLEDELGTELFTRSQKGALMTPAGIFFYPRAVTLVAEFDQLKNDLMDIKRSYRPVITICMVQGIYGIFAEKLMNYGKEHSSEMEIRIRSCLDADCDTILSDRKAEVVLSFTPTNSNIALSNLLVESEIVFLISKEDKNIEEIRKNPAVMKEMPHLLYNGGRDNCLWWKPLPRITDIVCSDLDYIFYLLRQGKGIFPIPRVMLPTFLDFAEVVPAYTRIQPCKIYYSTLYPQHYNALTISLMDDIHNEVFRNG